MSVETFVLLVFGCARFLVQFQRTKIVKATSKSKLSTLAWGRGGGGGGGSLDKLLKSFIIE